MPQLRHRLGRTAACLAVTAAVTTAAAPAASAEFVVEGRGFGHGIGLSQYGAYGFAKHGAGYKKILGHYFKRTRLGRAGGERVRVLVGSGGAISFSGASRACGKRLKEGKGYRFARSGGGVVLRSKTGARLAGCGKEGGARGGSTVGYSGYGPLRGELLAVKSGAGLNAVNRLRIDDYVKGVVPNEVPSSWPAHALRAQAVVARSYALSTTVDGHGFDLYDDTRSQVYGGKTTETPATNRAVNATSGKVVKVKGRVAVTFYHSTSGGRTESVQFGFSGAEPRAYLKAVNDPYDKTSPHHRWKRTFTRRALEARLGGLVSGRLKRIKVIRTGDSPRIVKARVIGTSGSESVSGATLQSRLGLMSTWARFKRR